MTAAEAGTAIITSQIYERARQRRDELQVVHDAVVPAFGDTGAVSSGTRVMR